MSLAQMVKRSSGKGAKGRLSFSAFLEYPFDAWRASVAKLGNREAWMGFLDSGVALPEGDGLSLAWEKVWGTLVDRVGFCLFSRRATR